MAASMYIVVEGDDPGYNIFVNGRALARHLLAIWGAEDAISPPEPAPWSWAETTPPSLCASCLRHSGIAPRMGF